MKSQVKILLPRRVQTIAGVSSAEFAPGTLRGILKALGDAHPRAAEMVCTPDGEPHRFTNISINGSDYRIKGIEQSLVMGDVVRVAIAVAGG